MLKQSKTEYGGRECKKKKKRSKQDTLALHREQTQTTLCESYLTGFHLFLLGWSMCMYVNTCFACNVGNKATFTLAFVSWMLL